MIWKLIIMYVYANASFDVDEFGPYANIYDCQKIATATVELVQNHKRLIDVYWDCVEVMK